MSADGQTNAYLGADTLLANKAFFKVVTFPGSVVSPMCIGQPPIQRTGADENFIMSTNECLFGIYLTTTNGLDDINVTLPLVSQLAPALVAIGAPLIYGLTWSVPFIRATSDPYKITIVPTGYTDKGCTVKTGAFTLYFRYTGNGTTHTFEVWC